MMLADAFNWLIVMGYLVVWIRLSCAAVDHETRGYARWAMIWLGLCLFMFGIGRWLYGQGISEDWLFVTAHYMLIGHGFLTIRVARKSREHTRNLMHELQRLKDGEG